VPIYEYRCEKCGASFEIMQKMSDDPLEICEECGGTLRKVMHPVAIHFKGSGFYTTDYGKGSGRPIGSRESSADSGESVEKSTAASGESASSGESATDKPATTAKDGGKPKEKQKTT
jgi:putative FmdB family regulatory protein